MKKVLYISFMRRLVAVVAVSALWLNPLYAQNSVEEAAGAKGKATVLNNMPYRVKGNVVNASTGEGFAGVRITSPNLQISAMTDEKGDFVMGVPDLQVTLYVEGPGFQRQEVAVKGREFVEIKIVEEFGKGFYDDGLVPTGSEYRATGIAEDGVLTLSSSMDDLLNGQLRAIAHSGEPGSGTTLFLRGLNSLNLSSQPLYVVDGVIWQTNEDGNSVIEGYCNDPLTLIAPNDIEDIKILKNGAAIWGAKAAGGVILIRTKRGREMATRIDANISFGFQSPFESLPMMGADAYKRYATDVMRGMEKGDLDKLHFTSEDATKSYYPETHNQTDWLDLINKSSFIQNYGISVSGGDNIALYRFSLGYADNGGNIDGTDFNRLNIRFNSDIKLTERFTVLADISYSQTGRSVAFSGLDEVRSPYYLAMVKSPLYSPNEYNGSGRLTSRLSDTDELNFGNPVVLTNNLPSLDKYRFNLNVAPSYRFSDRLQLKTQFSFSWDKENEELFLPDVGMADVPLYNEQNEVYATGLNEVRNFMSRQSSLSANVLLGWQVLGDYMNDLKIDFGGRFYNDYYRYTAGLGYNTGSDYMTGLSNTNSDLRTLTGYEHTERSGAWFANADYNYRHKYFLNLAMALESSSKFGPECDGVKMLCTRWGFFPSASAAWMVSSESFMQSVTFVNNLKLRLAYTVNGNDNLPLFANRTYFSSNSFARDATGLVLANIGNEKLKWETTSRTNIGLDLALFDNRWTVNADLFFSKTKDLLTQKSLNDVAGLDYFWSNDGELENRGFEIATNVRVVDASNLKLNVGATVGHYKNEIISLANGDYVTDVCGGQILTSERHAAGLFYGYKTEGVFSTTDEAERAGLAILSESGQRMAFEAGDVHFTDIKADGIIDENDRCVIGDPNPDFYGNFVLSLQYKQFELSALLTYSYGNDAYNAFRAGLESGSSLQNYTTAIENRWMAEGQITDVPRATYGDVMGNGRFSDRWIEDASYLKFKRLSLAYHIPIKLKFLQSLSVWGAATNILTFSKYLGSDPEFSYNSSVLMQGVDAGLTPSSRTFQFGVNISL